ncbi:hypothetical protein L3X38_016375 [Prunus dulcis]|uniref:Late embryogenesis abundant protein LEA-2 subgroup domain-containing protein n=1 Tax=Prunus dulcis TaxID=3755 RepID=A0AAD4W5U2_PRUDU|nr:hypothetical protein L3X38_016375 [Prunus dulcis]
MLVTIKVRNGDVYRMDYEALEVAVGYRGRSLGHVTFQRGHVRAFGSSYMEAEVEFNGVGVFSDVVLLLEDLAKGKVPFDTVTEVHGRLGFLFFEFPLHARVSCEVMVNTVNQTILRHNCYEVKLERIGYKLNIVSYICVKIGCEKMVSLNALAITRDQSKVHVPVRWRMLWRKIKKEKKRLLFDCSTSAQQVHVPYDPYTYSKNFDQGLMWADPDFLSRSFSARFAVPSRVFHQTQSVGS